MRMQELDRNNRLEFLRQQADYFREHFPKEWKDYIQPDIEAALERRKEERDEP